MKKTLAVMLLALAVGCASGSSTRTSSTHYAATNPSEVEILFEKPDRKYEVIGYVSGDGARLASEQAVFEAMKKEAAEIGADAILIRDAVQSRTNLYGQPAMKEGSALAIKWKR